jgi:hypothetical protein
MLTSADLSSIAETRPASSVSTSADAALRPRSSTLDSQPRLNIPAIREMTEFCPNTREERHTFQSVGNATLSSHASRNVSLHVFGPYLAFRLAFIIISHSTEPGLITFVLQPLTNSIELFGGPQLGPIDLYGIQEWGPRPLSASHSADYQAFVASILGLTIFLPSIPIPNTI